MENFNYKKTDKNSKENNKNSFLKTIAYHLSALNGGSALLVFSEDQLKKQVAPEFLLSDDEQIELLSLYPVFIN